MLKVKTEKFNKVILSDYHIDIRTTLTKSFQCLHYLYLCRGQCFNPLKDLYSVICTIV